MVHRLAMQCVMMNSSPVHSLVVNTQLSVSPFFFGFLEALHSGNSALLLQPELVALWI